ncbi:hypothetical protein N7510_000243 [Penicillium lagena]|uniref:uncharacterized protein n=1 Tax=Penicillium lagena TaxID=94218 RepID=UPI002541FD79|nr:uncharacterized protein N7510_000243 [Penicillium lagena]KAJ5623934.1 hypothetical protein N7510_000243 [Penicillium lagena]
MPQTAEDHIKLLLCCTKHCHERHIDFQEVSAELGLPSRAAAAKRYTRLLEAHGMDTMGLTIGCADKPAVSSADRLALGLKVDGESPNWEKLFSKNKSISINPSVDRVSTMGQQQITSDQGDDQEDFGQNVAKNHLTIVIPAKAIVSRKRRAAIITTRTPMLPSVMAATFHPSLVSEQDMASVFEGFSTD